MLAFFISPITGKQCVFKIPTIADWADGRHPMTNVDGVPYVLSGNVIYMLDSDTKEWLQIARLPDAGNSNYRVSITCASPESVT